MTQWGAGPYDQLPYGQPGYPSYGGAARAQNGLVQVGGLGTVQVAGVGQRFFARLIDSALYLVVFVVLLGFALAGLASSTSRHCDANGCHDSTSAGGFVWFFVAIGLLGVFGFVYEWLFIAIKGQTLGKMAIGIKVIREDTGQVPGFGKAFVRQVIPAAANLLCGIVGLLFYISVFFDNTGRSQTWYDRAAHDLVISVK